MNQPNFEKSINQSAMTTEDKLCNKETKQFLFSNYNLSQKELALSNNSPYFENDLSNYPKTLFIVGEYDGVRNHIEAYYEKLKKNGCDVTKFLFFGQSHNTIIMREVLKDGEDPAAVVAEVLKGA